MSLLKKDPAKEVFWGKGNNPDNPDCYCDARGPGKKWPEGHDERLNAIADTAKEASGDCDKVIRDTVVVDQSGNIVPPSKDAKKISEWKTDKILFEVYEEPDGVVRVIEKPLSGEVTKSTKGLLRKTQPEESTSCKDDSCGCKEEKDCIEDSCCEETCSCDSDTLKLILARLEAIEALLKK